MPGPNRGFDDDGREYIYLWCHQCEETTKHYRAEEVDGEWTCSECHGSGG